MRNKIEETFKGCEAIHKGHFVLKAGEHSDTYLEKEKIYGNSVVFENLCRAIAHEVSSKSIDIDAVVGSVHKLAQRVAYYLGEIRQKTVISLSVEKDGTGKRVFGRSFDQDLAGKDVLVVDDITITGESVRQIIKATILKKGHVVAVAVICNRGGVAPGNLYGLTIISLSKMKLKIWWENDCPLCQAKVPINANIERGREFLESHPDYPR
ncbi:MAG: hypothetical protein ABIG29_03415 [Candidatus Nealsonbacteria bacterium]